MSTFGLYTGGKGAFTVGGVRVPAFFRWSGTIEAGSVAGDIIHVTDLYTTFANIGGAKQHIPTDRVIDGIDQTAMLINGDTKGRVVNNVLTPSDFVAFNYLGKLTDLMICVIASKLYQA